MTPDTLIVCVIARSGRVTATVSASAILIVIGVLLLALLAKWLIGRMAGGGHWEAVEATIPLGSIGTVRITPNRETTQIAHRAWVELVSRKAALPFDPENDVIVEVYDSWYVLFREMRLLARECPAHLYRSDRNVRATVDLILRVLNDGLRPHLTRWQARFRAWYEEERRLHPSESPQSIQRRYDDHDALVSDLLVVNAGLRAYAELLKRLVVGRE